MLEKICKNCFEEMNSIPCPYCGYNGDLPEKGEILPPGTILNGKYMLGKVLGHGGFGITYLAYDMNFEVKVAIKEYYPDGLCTRTRDSKKIYTYSGEASDNYKYGLDKFVEEGKTMAKFRNLESIVDVRDYFRENNTAYLVMEYLEGIDLSGYLKKQPGNKLSLEETLSIITPILDTLEVVHAQGIIHRDISPDNIFITKDNKIKLLDFGAARYAMSEKSKSLSVILKQGYAPPEQYSSRGKQGPWTDVYAIGATMFRMLTGKVPLEAAERQMGDEEFKKDLNLLPDVIRGTIKDSMILLPEKRIQNIHELLEIFSDKNKNAYRSDIYSGVDNSGTNALEYTQINNFEEAQPNARERSAGDQFSSDNNVINIKREKMILWIFFIAYLCGIIAMFILSSSRGIPSVQMILVMVAIVLQYYIFSKVKKSRRLICTVNQNEYQNMRNSKIFLRIIFYFIMGIFCTWMFIVTFLWII